MREHIRYINNSKKRKTLSPIGFKEDIISPAHTLSAPGFSPYLSFKYVINLLEEIKCDLSDDCAEYLDKRIKELDKEL